MINVNGSYKLQDSNFKTTEVKSNLTLFKNITHWDYDPKWSCQQQDQDHYAEGQFLVLMTSCVC